MAKKYIGTLSRVRDEMTERFNMLNDFLSDYQNPIDAFFHPRSIAIVGATEKSPSVARTLLINLMTGGYKGQLYPINPKYQKIMNLPCYPSLEAVREEIDLCVIVTPAATVVGIVESCVKKRVPAVVVISAGFKEAGDEGIEREKKLLETIKGTSTRIIGPNCLGIMNPLIGLNASFSADIAYKGNIAFISQSGAMCTSVLDWSLKESVGFSAFVSIGSMADVEFADLIQYFGNDPATDMILIYMETIGNPRHFLSCAKKVAMVKPIILIKAGRTQAAKKAAASHTGSLAGSDEAFDTAIRRVGIMRVDRIEELFDTALILSKQPLPRGPHLTIITNAGGPAVLATDSAILSGAELTELHPSTIEKLNQFLPPAWSHSNPIDILGDADHKAYARALEVAAQDPHSDGILVVLTPQDMTEPLQTALSIAHFGKMGKPIFTSFMGGDKLRDGVRVLKASNIPNFPYPDQAAHTFGKLFKRQSELKALYETPPLREANIDHLQHRKKISEVDAIISLAIQEKREYLTEHESKKILSAYQIPQVETIVCHDQNSAVEAAEALGFPVVVKLHSSTITHKSDIGGVKLNLLTGEAVANAYDAIKKSVLTKYQLADFEGVTVQKMITSKGIELLVGSKVDEQFGPLILFGTGGILVEVFKDYTIGMPPLNATLARQMINGTKIHEALKGVRGKKSINFAKLEELLINFSKLVIEHPEILECDINPLLAFDDELIALDARFVLALDPAHMVKSAIRSYPTEYIALMTLKNNLLVRCRPIKPEDEPSIVKFHATLSKSTVVNRFFAEIPLQERVDHNRMIQICAIDYTTEMRLIAENSDHEILSVVSYQCLPNTKIAEIKLIVADSIQNLGLGKQMLLHLIEIAKKEGIQALHGIVSKTNTAMLALGASMKFQAKVDAKNPEFMHLSLEL